MVACAMDLNPGAIQLLQEAVVVGTTVQNSEVIINQILDVQRLLQDAVYKEDHDRAIEIISELERTSMTREVLEATRVGLTVNEVRKQASQWPEFARRCRALIKLWQRLADYKANSGYGSGTASTDGTPNLVSPATFGWRLTPPTPGKNSNNGNSRLTSPLIGRKDGVSVSVSPLPNENVYKSSSIGNNLCLFKSENTKGAHAQPLFTVLKRSKTSGYQLSQNGVSPPSLHEARKNVQPTIYLLNNLSQQLTKPYDLSTEETTSGVKNQVNSSFSDVTTSETVENSKIESTAKSKNLEDNTIRRRRYNWFKDYPISSKSQQSTSQNIDSTKPGKKLIFMPYNIF